MNEQTEKKSRLVRWWIGMVTSSLVLCFGGYLLLMRYALGHNPLGQGYWMITGLVLAFGAFRVTMQLLRRKYLFEDDDIIDKDKTNIRSTIPLVLLCILLPGLGGCATPSIEEEHLILRSAERFQNVKTVVILPPQKLDRSLHGHYAQKLQSLNGVDSVFIRLTPVLTKDLTGGQLNESDSAIISATLNDNGIGCFQRYTELRSIVIGMLPDSAHLQSPEMIASVCDSLRAKAISYIRAELIYQRSLDSLCDRMTSIFNQVLRDEYHCKTILHSELPDSLAYYPDTVLTTTGADAVLYYSFSQLVTMLDNKIITQLDIVMHDKQKGNLLEATYEIGKHNLSKEKNNINNVDYNLARRSIEIMLRQAFNPERRH